MLTRRAALLSLALAACSASPAPRAAANQPGAAPQVDFPAACRSQPAGSGQAPWHRTAGLTCQAVRAGDGGLVVLDAATAMLRRSNADGSLRWERGYPPGEVGEPCGAVAGLAIAGDDSVVVACGYTLVALDADGAPRWHQFPRGMNAMGPPLVDDAGTIYVAAAGALHAIAADGRLLWVASFGSDRSASSIGVSPGGDFLLDTTVDAWTGDDGTVYHPDDDPTVVVIGRDGAVRSESRDRTAWPAWIEVVDEGGGRVP